MWVQVCLGFLFVLPKNFFKKVFLDFINPASRPMTAGIGSSPPATRPTDEAGIENGWMDDFINEQSACPNITGLIWSIRVWEGSKGIQSIEVLCCYI